MEGNTLLDKRMNAFLSTAFSLPTALYSVSLLFVLVYWMLAIVGLFDIDTVDADVDLDGPEIDICVHDLDAPDFDVPDLGLHDLDAPDIHIDAPDIHLEGVHGPDLHAPEAHAPDLDGAAHSLTAFAKLLSALGFHRVPLTISISFIVFFGWLACFLAMDQVAPLVPSGTPSLAFSIAAPIVSFLAALPFASVSTRPLAPIFHIHKANSRRSFIGQTCEVSTQRVDARFGQAEIYDGGAGLTVQVRCDHENALKKGGEALIVHYDDTREAYVIEPLDTPRGQQLHQRVEEIRAKRLAAAKSSRRNARS